MKQVAALLVALGMLLSMMAVAQDEPLFIVIPNNNLNLRACASTECDRVGQVQAGTELPVYAVDGDWYQVLVDGELVWLAGWLTTRAPDKLLEAEEYWRDSHTGCDITIAKESGSTRDLAVLRSGAHRREVQVNVYLPDENEALLVQGRYDDTFTDTGNPYNLQYYSSSVRWPNGLYRIEVSRSRATTMFAWEMERSGEYSVFIHCERDTTPRRRAATQTPTPTQSSTRTLLFIRRNNAKVYDCARTDCRILGTLQLGTQVEVLGNTSGEFFAGSAHWVRIQFAGQPAYVHNSLLSDDFTDIKPGDGKLIPTGKMYRDSLTGCGIFVDTIDVDEDLNILLSGDRRSEIRANVYRPGEDSSLFVEGRLDGTFSNTGDPFIMQYHYWNSSWPDGLYRLEIELDGRNSMLAWQVEQGGLYTIRVDCGVALTSGPTVTPRSTSTRRPTLTPRPTATPRPTVTPRPTRTPVPAPDKVLEPDEIYRDSNTGCEVLLDGEGYDGDLNIVLSGDRWNDVEVKIFRPGASSPLRVSDRFNDVFEDTGDPFIWQYYSVNSPWRAGLYRLEITLDGRTSLLAWRLERAGDQVIYVFCDGPAPRPTRTPRPTATRRPGPTSRPSITPRPTRTPRPTVTPPVEHTEIRTGALYRDEATGCNVLVLEFPPEQADWKDLWVIRDGELRHDFTVRVWLPDSDSPVPVEDEFDDTWDTGEPGVWQTYSPRTDWRNGIYRIEVSLGDASSVMTWRMERAAYYQVGVSCYQQAGPAPSV